jgi:hypothetical protein
MIPMAVKSTGIFSLMSKYKVTTKIADTNQSVIVNLLSLTGGIDVDKAKPNHFCPLIKQVLG